MKQNGLFTAVIALLFSVSAFAQENKALQITQKDANNNVQKKVVIIPQDEDVFPHLKSADFPTEIESKIENELNNHYSNGENFNFVEQSNGTEYRFEITADSEKLKHNGERAHVLKKIRKERAPFHSNRNGNDVFLFNSSNNAYLGVAVKAFDHKATNSSIRGVEVTEVVEGEAAYNAGIEVGDIITKLNDWETPSPSLFKDAVSKVKPREEVSFSVSRNGNLQSMSAMAGKNEGMNFWQGREALPFQAKNFALDLEKIRGNKAQLGVLIADHDNGAEISQVNEGSAADKAGLQKGDIITEIDGNTMTSTEDVVEYLSDKEAEDEVKLKVLRDNKKKTIKVQLEEAKNFWFGTPQEIEIEEIINESNLENMLQDLELQLEQLGPKIEEQMKKIQPMLEEQMEKIETEVNTI